MTMIVTKMRTTSMTTIAAVKVMAVTRPAQLLYILGPLTLIPHLPTSSRFGIMAY
jgi:hypothetical protein